MLRLGLWQVVKCAIVVTAIYVTLLAKYASYQPDTRDLSFTRQCPYLDHSLRGGSVIDLEVEAPNSSRLEVVARELGVKPGGSWTSPHCPLTAGKQKVAIVIPYRDRWNHLSVLLTHLHPFLVRQQATYTVFIVEQAYQETFNKGLIMNVAFKEVMRQSNDWDCVIFHDVDMVPENDHNLYLCGRHPRHLAPALDNMRYTLMYPNLAGGVLALTPQHMAHVNGYSNLYWGWGAEDDDMALRILKSGYEIERPPSHIGRYKMAAHQKREAAPNRIELLGNWKRYQKEGLNSVSTFPVAILATTQHALYTNITVDIGSKPPVADIVYSRSNWAWFTDWLFLWKLNI